MLDWLAAPDYTTARWVVQHLVALVYVIAFTVALAQFRPLIGERGLTPIPRFLARTTFRRHPSLFHLRYSDTVFRVVAALGLVLAVAALAGATDVLPLGAGIALWAALWVLYLSIVNVGQVWYGFGWESLLLEAGFLVTFLGPADVAPPTPILWLLVWLLFRVEFGAGLIKLRGDRCWRDLTCLEYHHETQPLPGPTSRFFHHLPRPLHRAEVLANHVTQLVVPFLLFLPQPVASIAAVVVIVTQGWLVSSGNFAWLNLLTITLAFAAIDDARLGWLVSLPAPGPLPTWFAVLVIAVTVLMLALSVWPVLNMASGRQLMNAGITPVHLGNSYGAFGSVTREREEVVLEGTKDPHGGDDADWREYGFRAKPGDPYRRPPQLAPYHRRLDWLMWFAPLAPRMARSWLPGLLDRLLEADAPTLRLLRHDPFDGERPAWVRARLFRYRFTTRVERRETGAWWHRELIGDYLPARSRPTSRTSAP
ncbi:lipase maturation factor family protein [Actinomycetospora callitridis]|uniref:lipase maturation factor family protein n=1 Tax=Actinomycetospora callitridis TaxID=913944 RepID=UPI0023666B1B|nr:lipase maturation factor family protein [Actinomycetospora callitridis]MDD7921126.1 lipase maturation factor family protein [Actinomycetospora callitridis]